MTVGVLLASTWTLPLPVVTLLLPSRAVAALRTTLVEMSAADGERGGAAAERLAGGVGHDVEGRGQVGRFLRRHRHAAAAGGVDRGTGEGRAGAAIDVVVSDGPRHGDRFRGLLAAGAAGGDLRVQDQRGADGRSVVGRHCHAAPLECQRRSRGV